MHTQTILTDELQTAYGGDGGGGGGGGGGGAESYFGGGYTGEGFAGLSHTGYSGFSSLGGGQSYVSQPKPTVADLAAQARAEAAAAAAEAQAKANLYTGVAAAAGMLVSARVYGAAPTGIMATVASAFHQSRADTLNAIAGTISPPAPTMVDPRDWDSRNNTSPVGSSRESFSLSRGGHR